MKKLLICVLLLTGSMALAYEEGQVSSGIVSIYASDNTCGQLQSLLTRQRALFINSRWTGGRPYYASTTSCPGYTQANPAYVVSADKFFCRMGFVCEPISQGQ